MNQKAKEKLKEKFGGEDDKVHRATIKALEKAGVTVSDNGAEGLVYTYIGVRGKIEGEKE